MTIIELMAKDQKLDVMIEPTVAAGDVKSTKIHVEFSPEWAGYAKTAVFFTSSDVDNVIEQVMTDDTCKVPHEVIETANNLFIGVRGVIADTGAVKTSTLVKYKIEEGAPAGTGTTVPPTADVYQQLLSKTELLDKRLSNLLNGLTEDDEVKDVRVGADGITYTTAGDAVREQLGELHDIRLGANGVTYKTAGEAVRKQFAKVAEQLEKTLKKTELVIVKEADTKLGFYYAGLDDCEVGETAYLGTTTSDPRFFAYSCDVNEGDVFSLPEYVGYYTGTGYSSRIVIVGDDLKVVQTVEHTYLNENREFTVNAGGRLYVSSIVPDGSYDECFYLKRNYSYMKAIIDEVLKEVGEGGNITVDSSLSTTSTNPVQNKVVANRLQELLYMFADYVPLSTLREVENDIIQLSNNKADKSTTYTKTEVDAKFQNLPSGDGGGSNKTLLGEVVVTGHRKIQPLSIDYATGIITVDDCSFLPSENVRYTHSRVCIGKNTEVFRPNNVIPSELRSVGIGIEKISDNTLYLYSGNTKLESYAENSAIDLSAWYIEYSDVNHGSVAVDLSSIEHGKHLEVEVFSPSTEIATVTGLFVDVTDKDNIRYLNYGATNGIRASTGADDYSFDSVRSLYIGKRKGNAMPSRYNYDLRVDNDFIYVVAKNIVAYSDSDDKIPVYSIAEKSFLIKNNGLKTFKLSEGTMYKMLSEGTYLRIWEVHD